MVDFENDQPIPTLEEVLMKFPTLKFNIEMKAYAPNLGRSHLGTEVAKVIRKCNAKNRILVTSFDFFMLKSLEKEFPGLQSGFAYDDRMSSKLAEASKQWYAKSNGEVDQFEARDSKGFMRLLMEKVCRFDIGRFGMDRI